MSSSSKPGERPDSPAADAARPAYQRFIPREELGQVQSWQPSVLGPDREPPIKPMAPAEIAAALRAAATRAAQPERRVGDRRAPNGFEPLLSAEQASQTTMRPRTATAADAARAAQAPSAAAAPAAAPAPAAPSADAAPPAPPAPAGPTAEEWEARIAEARQNGYQEGYRDGLVALDGFKESYAQQMTGQIGALLEAFDRQLEQLDSRIADALAASAVRLARQVVRHEVQTQPQLVAQVAAEAVQAIMLSARQITVQVHPQDLALVQQGADDVLQARGARVVAHHGLSRGSVDVISDVGRVDAGIERRWHEAVSAMGSDLPLHDAPAPAHGADDPAREG